jgi:hypothetical protein
MNITYEPGLKEQSFKTVGIPQSVDAPQVKEVLRILYLRRVAATATDESGKVVGKVTRCEEPYFNELTAGIGGHGGVP